jgi:hypothetical protein
MRSYRQNIVTNIPQNEHLHERLTSKTSQHVTGRPSTEPGMEQHMCPFCQNREPLPGGNEHAFAIPDRRLVSRVTV